MNIQSLYCTGCSCEVPADHYGTMDEPGECPNPPMPVAAIMGILNKFTGDQSHRGNKMTATRLADCFRKVAIGDNLPITALNLEHFNAPVVWGSALHEFLRANTPRYIKAEVPLKGKLFAGTEYEIAMEGTADLVEPGVALLGDYKSHNLFRQQKLCKNPQAPHIEYDIQLSVYKELSPEPIERGVIWNGAMPARMSGVKPWLPVKVKFLTQDQILASRPFGGQRTVADHIRIYKKFLRDKETMPIEKAVNAVPLIGAEQETWVCEYCALEEICSKMARGR